MTTDPHDLPTGGHDPVDVDPLVPTGICRNCPIEPPPPEPLGE